MKIQISHLEAGLHTIALSEVPERFDLIDSEIFRSKIDVLLVLDKHQDALYIKQSIATTGDFICDRCTEPYRCEMASEERIVYSSDKELVKYDEELRYLAADQREIDITEDVREAVLLAVPAKKLCKKECKGICPQCGANLNHGDCNCTFTQTDPRWDALKKLMQ
jgi:uncharacterized protein